MSAEAAVRACLHEVDRHEVAVGAFLTVCRESALEEASAADVARARGQPVGPLHGVPFVLKDNIDTAGTRTTAGASFLADRIPSADAEVVRRLCGAGAILLGKASMHELAYGGTTQSVHFRSCRNPWDLERIPGGSSGGSAAAVAAGMARVALGTDTGGSVRNPAALTGVCGLRPTFGLVSVRGVMPLAWSFDTVGPLARSAKDLARITEVIAGYDPEDPTSVYTPWGQCTSRLDQGLEGVRVGVPVAFVREGLHPDVERAVEACGDALAALGAAVVELDLEGVETIEARTKPVLWADAFRAHKELLERHASAMQPRVRQRLLLGRDVSGADYAGARQQIRAWRRRVRAVFERVDILLTPTTPAPAPRVEEAEPLEDTFELTRLTYPWSSAGVPALSLPCGFTRHGLPIGAQLVAGRFGEPQLLAVAAAYQGVTTWHKQEPPLP